MTTNTGEEPKTNVEDAVRFLEWKRPGGPWALIAPTADWDRGTPLTLIREPDKLRAFIASKSGRFGVFYPVAEVLEGLEQQPEKRHLTETRLLHVDLDPPPGLAPAGFDEWARGKVEEVRAQTHSPPPSCIVMSGNGLHLLWALAPSHWLGGAEEIIADFEAYNNGLAVAFDAIDGTWNANRVLRLPGTINLPNKKKRKDGRTARPSSIVELHAERVYSLADFRAVPVEERGRPARKASPGRAATPAKDDVQRLSDPAELERWCVPLWVGAVIVEGTDPTNPERWGGDRSRAVYAVTCELARCGVPPGLIVGILTDEAWGISAHVRDQKPPTDYAWRQVDKAHEVVADSWPMRSVDTAVDWINRGYFAALEGRSVTYFREDDDRVQPMDDRAFHFELADREVLIPNQDGDDKRFAASKLWVGNARRRYYPRGFIIDPSGSRDPRAYNLWRGFGVEPRPGDWSRMEAHIRGPLSGGVAEHADYIINWFAWTVQNPATPPRVALVFRGGEGVGKGIVAYNFYRIFGHHGHYANAMDQIAGRFNSHLRHCCFLVADEIEANGREGGKLKSLITERHVSIEGKGKDIVQADNHLHVVMLSNERFVVPAGKDSRRYAVFDVSAERQRDHDYFAAIARQMDEGGREAMLHDLLGRELGDFHPERGRPDTDALAEQRAHSLAGFEKVFFDLLATGDLPPLPSTEELGGGSVFVATSELADFAARRLRREDVSWTEVGELFNRLTFEKIDRRPRGYVLPRLREARDAWTRVAFEYRWNDLGMWGLPQVSGFDGPEPY